MKKKFLMAAVLLFAVACAGDKARIVQKEEDPVAYSRLSAIAPRVIYAMDPENFSKYKLAIVDSPDVNAYAVGSDFTIVFLRGAISTFNDDELAFILAHEVAHLKLGHYGKRVGASVATTGAFTVANIFLPGVGLLNHLVNPLVVKGFSRGQEMDADALAVQSIQKCCSLSPDAAISAHQKLLAIAQAKGYKEEDRIGILDTHPSLEERIKRIEAMKVP